MNLTFAAQLNKMITAGLGGAVEAPETGVAVGRRVEYTSLGPAPILTFEANSELPLKALSVNMEPIQEGSGDPSPENIRPISGRQSVTVTRSGINIWDEEWEVGDVDATTGQDTPSNAVIRTKNYISVKPETEYFAHIGWQTGLAVRARFYDAEKNYIGTAPYGEAAVRYNSVFKTPTNCYYMRFTPQASYGTTYNHDISINYPSTDHDYHPGTVASVEMQLGQTVYGGTVDVVSGEMTVDRAMVDLGTLNWTYASTATYPRFATANTVSGAKGAVSDSDVANGVCSIYALASVNAISRGQRDMILSLSNAGYVWVRDSSKTDLASFLEAVTKQMLCYELAEPITVQLTPEQLTTVLGTNNVWSDADEVSLTYGNIYYTEGY